MAGQNLECDLLDQLLRENDDVIMPIPDFESEPHLLISKVVDVVLFKSSSTTSSRLSHYH